MVTSASDLLRQARRDAGLNQRELAERANTAQSVVARIELGQTSPSWDTLARLLGAAGFVLEPKLEADMAGTNRLVDDAARLLQLAPADRLRELRNVDRFLSMARRAG